jgi:uncharacterized membrane protein YqjE
MHPLLQLLVSQPALLAEHAQGYISLLGVEASALARSIRQQLVWGTAAALGASATVMLAGVALMLWAALPGLSANALWILALTPALPLFATLGCLLCLRAASHTTAFAQTKEQLQVDMQLLKEVSGP